MRSNGTDENQIKIFNGIENENENVINGISTDNLLPTNNKINDDEINNINNNNNYRRLNTDLFHSKNNCKRNEVSDKYKLILRSNKNLASNNNQEQKKVIVQIQYGKISTTNKAQKVKNQYPLFFNTHDHTIDNIEYISCKTKNKKTNKLLWKIHRIPKRNKLGKSQKIY